MNVSPIVPANLAVPVTAAAAANATPSARVRAVEAEAAPLVAPLVAAVVPASDAAASVVRLSAAGNLLRAVAGFIEGSRSSSAAGEAPEAPAAAAGTALLSATQDFVDAFNALPDGFNVGIYDLLGTLLDESGQMPLNATAGIGVPPLFATLTGNAKDITAALEDIGLSLREGGIGALGLDLDRLRAALATDPAATVALLRQAMGAAGNLVSGLAGTRAVLADSDIALLGTRLSALPVLALADTEGVTDEAALRRGLLDVALSQAVAEAAGGELDAAEIQEINAEVLQMLVNALNASRPLASLPVVAEELLLAPAAEGLVTAVAAGRAEIAAASAAPEFEVLPAATGAVGALAAAAAPAPTATVATAAPVVNVTPPSATAAGAVAAALSLALDPATAAAIAAYRSGERMFLVPRPPGRPLPPELEGVVGPVGAIRRLAEDVFA